MISINSILNVLRRRKHAAQLTFKKLLLGVSRPQIRLIVVGAQKSGTTALYHYLSEHPDIDVPAEKEVNYFNATKRQDISLEKYQQHFPVRLARNEDFFSIDVSPSYLLDAQVTAQRIFDINPNTKIAAVLREPVSRAVSSWFMYQKLYQNDPDWFVNSAWVKNNSTAKIVRRKKRFGESFEADIEEELLALEAGNRIEYPVVEYGLYKHQLSCFIDVFGLENLLVLSSEELKNSTQFCLDQITDFIDLKTHTLSERKLVPHFVGDNKKQIDRSKLAKLADYYKVHNKGLEELVDKKFNWGLKIS